MGSNSVTHQKFVELDEFIDHMEDRHGALISVLHKSQQLFGYLPQEVQLHVARKLDLPAAKVNGVVTFYSFFSEVPKGEHIISVCLGTACFVRGSEELLHELQDKLKIKAGQTTADGKLSLGTARCLGNCSLAPMLTVDDVVYGPETPDSAVEKLRSLVEVTDELG